MSSRAQQILIKRAQQQAALTDAEYRDAIALVSGMEDCRSSKDPRLTDGHVDKLLSYIEAIYWMNVDAGSLQPSCKPGAVFRERGFWATKNRTGNTSRDRYTEAHFTREVADLEAELNTLGFGLKYLAAIQNNIRPFSLIKYAGALKRTLASKRKKADAAATVDDDADPY